MRPPLGGENFWGRGGRDGGGRFGGGWPDEEPPELEEIVEVATFLHACEGVAVTKLSQENSIPYFNAPIYLWNRTQIGKVDEIFGAINESLFSIKMMEGIVATSYAKGDKFYIDPYKLIPLARLLPQPMRLYVGGRGGRGGRGPLGFRGRGIGPLGFRGRGRGGFFRGRGRGF